MKNKNSRKNQKKSEKKRLKRANKSKQKRLSEEKHRIDSQKKLDGLTNLLRMLPKKCSFCPEPFDQNQPGALDDWQATFRGSEILYRCPKCNENV
tara:strand:- start:2098 stop:2382 length:285 start_codon:yes stop_codon:yes gene_type:complete